MLEPCWRPFMPLPGIARSIEGFQEELVAPKLLPLLTLRLHSTQLLSNPASSTERQKRCGLQSGWAMSMARKAGFLFLCLSMHGTNTQAAGHKEE